MRSLIYTTYGILIFTIVYVFGGVTLTYCLGAETDLEVGAFYPLKDPETGQADGE